MYLSIIIYVMFAFFVLFLVISGVRFIIFRKINATSQLWNKNKILLLGSILLINFPLQLTVFILSLSSNSYEFIIGGEISSEKQITLILLILTFICFITSVVYFILIIDYLAVKFDTQFVYFLGKKILLENITEIFKDQTGYFVITYFVGSKDKAIKKVNLNRNSLVGQFILNNYEDLIVAHNKKIIIMEDNK